MPENKTQPWSNLKIRKNKNSEAEMEGEIPTAEMEIYRRRVLAGMRTDFAMPGFRKGRVPEEVFLKHVNEMSVLEEAADAALQDVYPQILEENKLDVIGAPEVVITKLTPGNPIGFKIRAGLQPEVKLPDYKSIAKKINAQKTEVAVTDQEVDEVVAQVQAMRAGTKKNEPAELTDEFVKTLGNFQNVAAFKAKIKDNLKEEKGTEETAKKRRKTTEEIGRGTKVTIPPILIENELAATQRRFRKRVADMGQTPEEYLKSANKTEADMEKEQRAYVEKQFREKFALDAIIRQEKIQADPKEAEARAAAMHARQPEISLPRLRAYAENMLTEEKIFELLEKQ